MVFAFVWAMCCFYLYVIYERGIVYVRRSFVKLLKWAWLAGTINALIFYLITT